MFRTLDDFNDQPFHVTGIGAILIFEGQNNRMVRCRNSENFPVIEIVPSPSALSKLLLIFESDLMNPVSSVLKAYLITTNPNLSYSYAL